MQQEMIRLHRGEENQLGQMAERLFKPLWVKLDEVLLEGIESGELIRVDLAQLRYATIGANVFYYLSAPLTKLAFGIDPLSHSELEYRRRVSIEYLGQTIFTDREHGKRVAERVLAATPMPESSSNR